MTGWAEIHYNSTGWLKAVMVLGPFVTPALIVAMVLAYWLMMARARRQIDIHLRAAIRQMVRDEIRCAAADALKRADRRERVAGEGH